MDSSVMILDSDTREFITTLGIGVAMLLATSVDMVMPVDVVTEVDRELLEPKRNGDGRAVLGTMLLQTSANA